MSFNLFLQIMKSDEDVRMISAEAPVLFAKACEFFILEMTKRAWNVAQEQHRRTLQRSDIAVAIARTHIWDFLLDTVPLQEAIDATAAENRDEEGAQQAAAAATGTTAAPAVTSAGPSLPSSVPSGAASMPPGMNMFAPQFLPPMGPYNPMMPQGLPYPPPGMFPSLQQYQSGMPQQLGQDPTSNASTGGRTDNS
jgi:histone H3/H4